MEITLEKVSSNDFRPCYNITKSTTGFTFQPKDCRNGSLTWTAGQTTFDWLAILNK